ncbi:hypothetical protein FACS189437_10490 [Bacteroidia bacterium]|nr:hypothetical protein FACS189437_10490 [Bacteroidia bacterium]
MVRTVITPEDTNILLSIPEIYVGKTIEITYLALDELTLQPKKTLGDFWGVLSEEDGRLLKEHTQRARQEWNRDF